MITWHPDFCPDDPATGRPSSCVLILRNDWSAVVEVARRCSHHASVQDANKLDDQALFDVILQSSRVKEAARSAAKAHLELDKDHGGVPYRVEADGSFTVGVTKGGDVFPGLDARKSELQTKIDTEVGKIEKPTGVSAVRLA